MSPIEDYQDVLQNIASAVIHVWRQNPAMTVKLLIVFITKFEWRFRS